MKKLLALVLVACMILAVGAFSAFADEGDLIGISMPTKSLERWNRDGTYLKEQFEAAGYKVELTYSDNDAVKQNNDIANMIADGVKVLIISAIDSDSLSSVLADVAIDADSLSATLADAAEAGITVIAYDRLINNADIAYYVSFDNYTVGVLQAKYVIDALDLENAGDKTFNIEFTAGDPADTNAGYFFSGAFDTLKPFIDAGTLKIPSGKTTFEQVATPQWSTDTALENFQNTLASFYGDGTVLDIALCSNDSTAAGVAQAIVSDYAGENQPIVTGQDGDIGNLQNIVDGIQTMTVYKNVSDEAGVTLVLVDAILNGETPGAELCEKFSADAAFDTETYDNGLGVVPSYLLVPYSIDASNLDLLVETGNYEWDADHQYLVSTLG